MQLFQHHSGESHPMSKYDPNYPKRFVLVYRFWYKLKAIARIVRIGRLVTKLCGFKYRRSRQMIEIDITYACNLHCNNCNRSSAQAPEVVEISVNIVADFVNESIAKDFKWDRIRVLGGEPTLHTQFFAILNELLRFKRFRPSCVIEIVTNGHGSKVQGILQQLPKDVRIANSNKTGSLQPQFVPFNLAPIDDLSFRFSDFRNGCSIIRDCGIGLTPMGYYPCAIAGGIARVEGIYRGRCHIPDADDDMRDLLDHFCRLCGRFKRDYVPVKLRPRIVDNPMSPSWKEIYSKWNLRKPGTGLPGH
jgi:hypothetical protein